MRVLPLRLEQESEPLALRRHEELSRLDAQALAREIEQAQAAVRTSLFPAKIAGERTILERILKETENGRALVEIQPR